METGMNVDTRCRLVAEYVDDREVPADVAPGRIKEPPSEYLAEFLDLEGEDGPDDTPTIQTLLRVVQTETHGPSRAQMVESIVRLRALDLFRRILGSEPVSEAQRPAVCSTLENLVAPNKAPSPRVTPQSPKE